MQFAQMRRMTGALVLLLSAPVQAQEPPPGVYIIFDGSGSMWGKLEDESFKINAATVMKTAGIIAAIAPKPSISFDRNWFDI